MILRYEAIERLPWRHQLTAEDGSIIGTGELTKALEGTVSYGGRRYSFLAEKKEGQRSAEGVINSDGMVIGRITAGFERISGGKIFQKGYFFYLFELNGTHYTVYESASGKSDHYYTVYTGDKICGAIYKEPVVKNQLNRYILYTENEMLVLILYTLFLEAYINLPSYNRANSLVSNKRYRTNKEQLDKYDSTYIERIKALKQNN